MEDRDIPGAHPAVRGVPVRHGGRRVHGTLPPKTSSTTTGQQGAHGNLCRASLGHQDQPDGTPATTAFLWRARRDTTEREQARRRPGNPQHARRRRTSNPGDATARDTFDRCRGHRGQQGRQHRQPETAGGQQARKARRQDPGVAEQERRGAEDAVLVAESTSASSGVKRAPATETEDLEQEAGTMEIERPTGEKRPADNAEDPTKRLRIGGLVAATLYRPDDPEEREFYDNAGDYLLDQEEEDELEDPEGAYAEEVKAGKLKELGKMDKYDAYEPRPLTEAQGKKILDSTWVVTRRPTGEVKCRYCLRDLKRGKKRDDVFAVASSQATARLIDTIGVKKGYVFFTADAENAYWQVPIKEEVYMYPPDEWLEAKREAGLPYRGIVWRLKKEWYGRQIAGQSFVDWAAEQAKAEGFNRCEVAPWFFYNPARDASMEVHMDDFYGTAPENEARAFLESLSRRVVMKYQIHRPGDQFEHLKRIRVVHEDGLMIKPNPKYLDGMLDTLGLAKANSSPTPETAGQHDGEDVPLEEDKCFEYRSCVGKALYLSFDRPDCQHAVRELTKFMKGPTAGAMNALRRLARYLSGTRDMGVWLPRADPWSTSTASRTPTGQTASVQERAAQEEFSWLVVAWSGPTAGA